VKVDLLGAHGRGARLIFLFTRNDYGSPLEFTRGGEHVVLGARGPNIA
jgi:hypothetical protein